MSVRRAGRPALLVVPALLAADNAGPSRDHAIAQVFSVHAPRPGRWSLRPGRWSLRPTDGGFRGMPGVLAASRGCAALVVVGSGLHDSTVLLRGAGEDDQAWRRRLAGALVPALLHVPARMWSPAVLRQGVGPR